MSMTVARFCEITGIPRANWYRWRSAGSSVKGPWPTPAQDALEAAAKDVAGRWDGWGHRKLAELVREQHRVAVSDSMMFRVLKRNGLTLPVGHSGDVGQLAAARKQTFIEAPTRRNRLWQADFSEFETSEVGTWNLGGVVDDVARVNLACTVTVTKTTDDAIAMFEAALAQVEILLGVSWIEDLTDPETGEIAKLVLVTDNGPCFKSARFAGWVNAQRHLRHVRTRVKAPWTNGRVERYFRSIKYEHLYRREIADGDELNRQCTDYRTIYNSIRPHDGLANATPLKIYRQPPTPNLPAGEDVSKP